jgi:small subunit ribosomal protein S17
MPTPPTIATRGSRAWAKRRVPHPVYGKMVTRTKKLKAHDEENTAKTGDTVRITETRPLSKDKRWRVVEIVERAR